MASVSTKPKSEVAETSSQEPDRAIPLEDPDKAIPLEDPDNAIPLEDPDKAIPLEDPDRAIPLEDPDKESFPTSSSSSSSEIKALEISSDPSYDTSPGDVSTSPSATVTSDQELAQLTLIAALKELVKIVPNQETLPILSPSVSYGGLEDRPIHAAAATSKGDPLIKSEKTEHGHQFLGSDSPTNVEFRSQQNSDDHMSLVPEYTCMQSYVLYAIYLSNSLFIVPFFLVLFGMSALACYMGGAYYDQCQLMQNVPLFFVFMGAFGALGAWARIISLLCRKGWLPGHGDCRYANIAILVAVVVFYVIEISEYVYYMNDYTTEQGPGYCDPFFYNYVWWNNWATFLIFMLLIVVHVPNSTSLAK